MTGNKAGILGCVLLLQNRVSLLTVSLLLISLSCSPRGKTSEIRVREQATKNTTNLPSEAMSLSAVLKAVESAGYAPVIEVEFEEGYWKVKAYRDGQLLQLKVSPLAGEILPNPPPTLEKPLSVVVKGLEDHGYGPILDVERSGGGSGSSSAWEVEAYKDGSEVALTVEPATGKITPK